MTNKRAAELLSDVTVLDDSEMSEAHDLAISALKQQDFICRITNLPCSACKPGPCDSRKELVTDRHQMTNADRINAMAIEEKASFLESIAYARETPWSEAFAEKFCKNCPKPEYTLDDGRKLRLNECDFVDGKCPHGSDIVWWLQQPAERLGQECCADQMEEKK